MPAQLPVNVPPRPFQNVHGRDFSNDRQPEFDIARYYYDQRVHIAEDADILKALIGAIHAEYDLTPAQWAQWYAVTLGFRPDLIVELGRSKGNSTALFCQAAWRLGRTRVVSLCNSKDWSDHSLPRVKPLVPARWLDVLDSRTTEILDVDYEKLLHGSERVLLLWDAHGFEIAEMVLGHILPLVADRSHLVLMHDISDNRYAAVPRSYEHQPLWKGSTWDTGTGRPTTFVNIGWMTSLQDQVIAIADFSVRNDIEIGSADHEYAQFFGARPEYAQDMQRLLGEFFSVSAHWAFFSLTGKQPPFQFPAVQRRFRHRCGVMIRDIHPPRWFPRSVSFPRTIQTTAVKWEYAAVMGWRPSAEIPADATVSFRLRVQVEDGPIGVGLLSADRSAFLESQRVLPGLHSQTVFLPLRDMSTAGPLVVHTWDVPEAARVCIEDISLVW